MRIILAAILVCFCTGAYAQEQEVDKACSDAYNHALAIRAELYKKCFDSSKSFWTGKIHYGDFIKCRDNVRKTFEVEKYIGNCPTPNLDDPLTDDQLSIYDI